MVEVLLLKQIDLHVLTMWNLDANSVSVVDLLTHKTAMVGVVWGQNRRS